MNKSIYQAYEALTPDDAAKERMLNGIFAEASKEAAVGKRKNMKRINLKRTICIIAAAVMIAGLGVTGYAVGWFGLNDRSLGVDMVGPDDAQHTAEIISVTGYTGSPEYQAAVEWFEFANSYDKDKSILATIGNGPTGLDPKYDEYCCYTQTMADKIDEICSKYNLKLMERAQTCENPAEIFAKAGTGAFYNPADEGHSTITYSSWAYPDGSFHMEGETYLTDASLNWSYPINYQFVRSMKGVFSTVTLNIGDAANYEQWSYVTKSGVEVMLCQSADKELIIAELDNSYVLVNILYPQESGQQKNHAALEAFADTFDFSMIP